MLPAVEVLIYPMLPTVELLIYRMLPPSTAISLLGYVLEYQYGFQSSTMFISIAIVLKYYNF
jgi:hypothetical protein